MYNAYQWIWDLVGTVEDYEEYAEYLVKCLKEDENINPRNLLHLGCGSGCIDFHLKRHFDITGVDLSEKMLESAGKKNPECLYIQGDMRDVRIDDSFDAIIIPESINYMRTRNDINRVFTNAKKLLKKEGILLVTVGYDPLCFPQNRTTVEQINSKGVELTFIENNYTPDRAENYFEAVFVFLIRKGGILQIVTDVHTLGLFEREVWAEEMKKTGFETRFIRDKKLEKIEQKGTFMFIGRNI